MILSDKKRYCISCGKLLFHRNQRHCSNCNTESCREFTWFIFIDYEQYGKRKCLENPIPCGLQIGCRNQAKYHSWDFAVDGCRKKGYRYDFSKPG